MNKKTVKFIFVMAVVVLLMGCGSTKANGAERTTKEKKEKEEVKQEIPTQESQEKQINSEKPMQIESETEKTTTISVYFGNEDATAFVQEDTLIESLSPEAILSVLVSKGVLASDVKVNEFILTEVNGKKAIEIDVNDAFLNYVNTVGATGEYYIIGGFCNTFLRAYNCDQMEITVNGCVLETGHAEYPEYLLMFE